MFNKVKLFRNIVIYFALFLILPAFIIFVIRTLIFTPKVPSRSETFLKYVEEYTQVAEFYYNDFSDYNEDVLIYSVPMWNDSNDTDIVCYEDGHILDIYTDEELRRDFVKILNSYHLDKQYLDYICVYHDFVSFCNNNGRASYVYSLNDSEPVYIKHSNEQQEKIYVKKLCNNWYFISESY